VPPEQFVIAARGVACRQRSEGGTARHAEYVSERRLEKTAWLSQLCVAYQEAEEPDAQLRRWYAGRMIATNLTFDCADAARSIANFSVGLAKLVVHGNAEDAIAAGSGTLVTVGAVAGILTAAHVVKNLPDAGDVALMRFPGKPSLLQKQTVDMALAEKLVIAGGNDGPTGPDLGFVRLPMVNAQNLRATNSFLNIGERHGVELPSHKGSAYVDAVVGVVSEWTSDLPPARPGTRMKSFELLYCGGTVIAKYQPEAYDLCTFRPDFESGKKAPGSYGGVSGGGLWRTYFVPDGSNYVIENRLVGVAFYEFRGEDGTMQLVCHGPRSIYVQAIAKIKEKCQARPLDPAIAMGATKRPCP
jgi:hypothetical protein